MIKDFASWQFLVVFAAAIVAVSVVATTGLTRLFFPLFIRYAITHPNARSSHKVPTPQGGGIVVIAITIFTTVVAFMYLLPANGAICEIVAILTAVVALAVVGAIDDIRTIAVVPRLVLQLIAVAVVVLMLPADLRIVSALPWWLERIVLVLGTLWFVNLVNFMDGIDWMTVAEVVPVGGGLITLGFIGALPPHGLVVALALVGAVLGFAPFNRPVARLFLGDVGSLPIGLLLGWLLILVAGRGHLAAAIVLPLYYLADATITLIRRTLNGERIWQAHRTHFYQRAIDSGFTVDEIVVRVFILNVVLASIALVTVLMPSPLITAGALIIAAGLVTWLLVSLASSKH